MNGKVKILSLGILAGIAAGAAPFVLQVKAVPNAATAASPSTTSTSSVALNDGQKKEIEALVKDYILNNPEVIMESVNNYRQKQSAEQESKANEALKTIGDDLFKNPNLPEVGNKSGDITVVEFFDYNCGYCKKGFETVNEAIQKDNNVRVILVDYPILSEASTLASKYSLAAQKQGKFFEYHKALMTFQGPKTEETIVKLSKDAGLDVEKLKADVKLPEIEAQIQKNQELAGKLAITGTPAFIVGDQVIRGYMPYEAMKTMIEDQRKKKS